MSFPDPVLSANLYCHGRLDEVIYRLVSPFWHAADLGGGYLWFMRYDRGGDHLKIRCHGPGSIQADVKDLLTRHATSYFESLGPATSTTADGNSLTSPPIDIEDAAESAYDDRSLLWTQYQRNSMALGSSPFLDEERYVSRITQCHARGCQRAMERLVPDATGACSNSLRQTSLLESMIEALAVLEPSQHRSYLQYHRDGLIRHLAIASGKGIARARAILHRYDLQAQKREASLRGLRKAMESLASDSTTTPSSLWQSSLDDLIASIQPLIQEPSYHIDPFAQDPAFPVLFRVLHHHANQLGLDALNEGLAYHLLLGAARGNKDTSKGFLLLPS